MLVVYMGYVQRMETVADDIESQFDRADDMNEIDCCFEEALDKLQSIYWNACDDSRIRKKELAKLEELKEWCGNDVRHAYDNYTYGMDHDIFAPDSAYDI